MPIAVPKPSMWAPGFNGDHPLARGCVLYLPLWEGGGLKAFDVSGRGHVGTLTGGPTWAQTRYGPALNFDTGGVRNSNKYVVTSAVPLGVPMTAAALVRPDDYPGVGLNTIMFGGGAAQAWDSTWWLEALFDSSPAGDIDYLRFYVNGTSVIYKAVDVPVGTWAHVAVTRDAAGACVLYLNGAAIDTGSNGNAPTTQNGVQIGNIINNDYPWDGLIASAAIWNRALTAAEVRELYEQPWALIEQEDDWEMYAAATQGGGTPIPVFDQYYRRMRAA